jgi:hypothetical protein
MISTGISTDDTGPIAHSEHSPWTLASPVDTNGSSSVRVGVLLW